MIGSFLTGALALVFGYAYPAYECFKTVELNKPEIEQLRFWCQYWILVAALTVFERVGESFISWLPMYSEAKVAFFVYLWYPKTRGTAYVYETFFRPYVTKHENEIDRNLLELRTRAGDMVILYSQRIASYGQTRFFEILQYVASQSQSQPSRPRPPQQRQQPQQARQTVAATATRQPAVPPQLQQVARPPLLPSSPTKSQQPQQTRQTVAASATRQPAVPPQFQQGAHPPPLPASPTKSQVQEPAKAGVAPSSVVAPHSSAARLQSLGNTTSLPASSETVSSSTSPIEAEAMQVEVANAASIKDSNPLPQETPMEEALRLTRGRLRKRAATAGPETR